MKGEPVDLEIEQTGMPVERKDEVAVGSGERAEALRTGRGKGRKRDRTAETRDTSFQMNDGRATSSEQLAQSTPVPPVPVDVCVPLVWVEAEQVFVARGYIYCVKGKCGGMRDSEAMIARSGPDRFSVLSSYAPAQFEAKRLRSWKEVASVSDLAEGERLGDVIVAVRHGANEYTVVNTAAYSVYLAKGSR